MFEPADTHDNFAKVVAAIPALVERGVKVRIATAVQSIEDAELDRLRGAAPRSRSAGLDELIAAGSALPFAPAGRRFREWVAVPEDAHESWSALLEEAEMWGR